MSCSTIKFFFLCFVVLSADQLTPGLACESGWVPGITNGCYKFVTKPASWSKAEAACQNLSGALVTLDTETKAAFVAGYIMFRGWADLKDDGWWLAAKRNRYSEFEWTSRYAYVKQLSYTRWMIGKPDNNGDEQCVMLRSRRVFKWDDSECGKSKKYICERIGNVNDLIG